MWETLQSIAIGLLAPIGVWLGWFLQRRDKASEKDRQSKDLLRSKAEEIYQEIEVVRDRNRTALMGAIEYLYKSDAELSELMPGLGRLKALVNMYFPAGTQVIADYDIAIHAPVQALSDLFAGIDQNAPIADRLKQSKEARLACVQQASKIMIPFLHKLTVFINGEVKSLL